MQGGKELVQLEGKNGAAFHTSEQEGARMQQTQNAATTF